MKNLLNQHFFLRNSKSHEKSLSIIYLRISIGGMRAEFSTGRRCDPQKWIPQAGRIAGKSEATRRFNNYLDAIEHRIYEIHKDMILEGVDLTAELIKAKYLGISGYTRTLVEVYEEHNRQFAGLVGRQFSAGTLGKFKTALDSLRDFIKWKFNKTDIPIKSLKYQFITDYEYYLKSIRGLQHNTAMGTIKKLKKIIRQCVANEWIDKDPFLNYKVKIHETHRAILTEEELKIISDKFLPIQRLALVRDIFLFSCFTGLAYCDVAKLTMNDIFIGVDGEKWISINRTKTNEATRLPLLSTPLEILKKYKDHPKTKNTGRLLPVLSNQRMNSYLKEIADICGINKELTFHCARHTFATTVTLTNGVPIESVSKMLGHKSLRTTQIYAKVLDVKVSDDMKLLKDKYSQK